MKARKFWMFTVLFWLIAGVVLWIDALWIDHWRRVWVRFFYFPALGILVSAVLTLIYQAGWFRKLKYPLAWIMLFSLLAAMVLIAILNPMTYLILGIEIAGRHPEVFTRGAMVHTMFFLAWSLIYFYLGGRPATANSAARSGDYINRISVDDRGRVRHLPIEEIECILASGDYIEIHLDGRSFLKKGTISALEQILNPDRFSRIHRSTMINRDLAVAVKPSGNSTYAITLSSGRVVQSSRSYRPAIQSLQTASATR